MSLSLLDPLPQEFDMHPQVIELIRIGQRHGESRHFRFNAVERLQSVRVLLGRHACLPLQVDRQAEASALAPGSCGDVV